MKDFKKYYRLPVAPDIVYAALVNEHTIQLWTGEPAVMQAIPGTEFSMWDGNICGKNIAFEEGKKIVQEWYFGEQEIPSVVSIILHADKQKTSMEVRHTNIPDEAYEDICVGWDELYYASLLDFYSEG